MSKYSHYEMCEKIFGQRYKWNEQKQDYELYSRTDMWNKLIEQQDKIADLELKLAESEGKVAVGRFWHSAYEGKQLDYDKLNNDYNKQEKLLSEVLANKSKLQFEFDQLQQQLAEKEKEIEVLQHYNDRLAQGIYHSYGEHFVLKIRQDKISFAVEQLEKVKAFCDGMKWSMVYITQEDTTTIQTVLDEIDNQIKQLKEME